MFLLLQALLQPLRQLHLTAWTFLIQLLFLFQLQLPSQLRDPDGLCHRTNPYIPTPPFLPFLQWLLSRYLSSLQPLLFEHVLKMELNNIHSNLLHLALVEWPAPWPHWI